MAPPSHALYSTTLILSGAQPPWKPCGTRTGRRIVKLGAFSPKRGLRGSVRHDELLCYDIKSDPCAVINQTNVLIEPKV